ncbi:MAG: hypothetical protein SYC29_13290 [Planctomycetota bacterium]|nr:hypothetical protein [Planctomycetota bacterium]
MHHHRSSKLRSAWLAPAVAALALAAMTAQAETYYVNGATGNDAWDGLCEEWDGGACGPKQTIQAGIDAASNGDEVIVADGVYAGAGNTNLDPAGRAITLASANGPDNCIVDIDFTTAPGFRCTSGETRNTIIDGFTVRKCAGC